MAGKQWDEAMLTQMRQVGDPWADGIVQNLLDLGGDEEVEKLLRQVVSVQDTVPDDLTPDFRNYLLSTDKPDWVDMKLVAAGEDFYARNGIEIAVILLCASLPACYAMAKGVHVLDLSRQLTNHPERRILETSRFLLDVMAPGGLSGGGHGALTAKKIRVLHATMRYVMRTLPQKQLGETVLWNEAEWGLPLNQEDLALTLMTFSTVVLESLKKLNVDVHASDEIAYFHAWRYIGYLMGVKGEVNPVSPEDGLSLWGAIAKLEYGPSEAGRHVTHDLVRFLEELIPGTLFDGIIPSKIRFLMGDEVSDMLDVPKADWTKVLIPLIRALHGAEHLVSDHSAMFSKITDALGRELLKRMESYLRTDGRPMFHVPGALREAWRLPPPQLAVVNAAPAVRPGVTSSPE